MNAWDSAVAFPNWDAKQPKMVAARVAPLANLLGLLVGRPCLVVISGVLSLTVVAGRGGLCGCGVLGGVKCTCLGVSGDASPVVGRGVGGGSPCVLGTVPDGAGE